MREPWRNLYAHLKAAGLQPEASHPVLDAMIHGRVNTPMASSCGRLFDAVAAALGICAQQQNHEGEAAARLEALADPHTLRHEDDALAYPLSVSMPSSGGIALIGYRADVAGTHRRCRQRHAVRRHRGTFPQGGGHRHRRDDAHSRRTGKLRHGCPVRRLFSERHPAGADRATPAGCRVRRADAQHRSVQ